MFKYKLPPPQLKLTLVVLHPLVDSSLKHEQRACAAASRQDARVWAPLQREARSANTGSTL